MNERKNSLEALSRPSNDKFERIMEGGQMCFGTAGFKRTHMADIAAASGVALGTLYRYFDSKDELFALCLMFSAGEDVERFRDSGLAPQSARAVMERGLPGWCTFPLIDDALAGKTQDFALEDLIRELFDIISEKRFILRMLDRSARDWPEIGEVFVTKVFKPVLLFIEDSLKRLSDHGQIRSLDDVRASARLLHETCSWFAMHRHFSPEPLPISREQARELVVDHLKASFHANPV